MFVKKSIVFAIGIVTILLSGGCGSAQSPLESEAEPEQVIATEREAETEPAITAESEAELEPAIVAEGETETEGVTLAEDVQEAVAAEESYLVYDKLVKDAYGTEYVADVDEKAGYLLYCSSPALGQMEKYLFFTEDGGSTYSDGIDLSTVIQNYPSGMIFFTEQIGYVLTNYHHVDSYLYRTQDGGRTWSTVRLEVPGEEELSYLSGISISRTKGFGTDGELYLEGVGLEEKLTYHFVTHDSGETWELIGE